jgi:hypothetical protein
MRLLVGFTLWLAALAGLSVEDKRALVAFLRALSGKVQEGR